jgi:hypothetical protein
VLRFAGHSPTRRQRGTAQARAVQHFLVDLTFLYSFGRLELVDHCKWIWAAKFGGDGWPGWWKWVAKSV